MHDDPQPFDPFPPARRPCHFCGRPAHFVEVESRRPYCSELCRRMVATGTPIPHKEPADGRNE